MLSRMEVVVIVRADMPETAAGTNVVVRVPVPRNAVSVNTEVRAVHRYRGSRILLRRTTCSRFLPASNSRLSSSSMCAELSLLPSSGACGRVQNANACAFVPLAMDLRSYLDGVCYFRFLVQVEMRVPGQTAEYSANEHRVS